MIKSLVIYAEPSYSVYYSDPFSVTSLGFENHLHLYGRKSMEQPDLQLLQPILKSVDKGKVLSIKYHFNYKQERTDRLVEPIGIFYADQYWHLIAWCRMRKDYRDFRLDRIIH